jgi:hypothetical protein
MSETFTSSVLRPDSFVQWYTLGVSWRMASSPVVKSPVISFIRSSEVAVMLPLESVTSVPAP